MKVTIQFNVGMTFALIAYAALLAPLSYDDSSSLLIESMFEDSPGLQILFIVLSAVSGVVASMYIIRALWNRLFPNLCGWGEINLAESYALGLFIGMFFIQ